MAVLRLSSLSLRFADASFANSYVPPVAAKRSQSRKHKTKRCLVVPNTAIVPPPLVNTPHAFTLLFVRVFCIAATASPAAPVISVPLIVALIVSFGWY